ncbi:ankyrin-1-like [Trichogramma pretiosum]|uniref:ankyrin-1-like n=1 Tax=Trichogramma pretiosum TaxID=7493 RepID=UPI000C71ADEF|nr:ankyrin-1-like [Trichogramma pretiosum]
MSAPDGENGVFLFMDEDVLENDSEEVYQFYKFENELMFLKNTIDFKNEIKRLEFLVKLDSLIEAWEGNPPDLRKIFGDGEVELLIFDYIPNRMKRRLSWEESQAAARFIRFVIDAGYNNEPKLENDQVTSVRGTTPIHQAYEFGYYNVVEDLFEVYNRFDVTYIDDRGMTHFHIACNHGRIDIVSKFLEAPGRNIDCQSYTLTPLCLALQQGHTRVVEELLKKGANPNLEHPKKSTPLHFICKKNKYTNLAEVFVELCDKFSKENPVRIDKQDESDRTPLHWALQHSDASTTTIEFLLKSGADPNSVDAEGSTPLHIICQRQEYKDDKSAELFFKIMDDRQQTVQIDAKDNSERTPLQWAVANFLPSVVKILLDHCADLSNFCFPEESHLKEIVRGYDGKKFQMPMHKLIFASRTLETLHILKLKGYQLEQDDAMKIMKVFAKFKMFEKSADNVDPNWYDRDSAFAKKAKKIMFTGRLSLYSLIRSQYVQDYAERLTYENYTEFVRSSGWDELLLTRLWQICDVRLCERLLARFFQNWSLKPFMNLTQRRLPELCSEMVLEKLNDEDLFNICFGASGQSPELLTNEPVNSVNVVL